MKKTESVRRCRLCACEEHLNNLYSIFEKNPPSDIELKITKLLPVVVMPWDPMPHKICRPCIAKLNHFNEFYEDCLRAERFLQTLYPSTAIDRSESFESVVGFLERPLLDNTFTFSHTHGTSSGTPDGHPKKNRSCFIINELTKSDCIFTCRQCFRTFTKESSALTHTCVRLEDCEELGLVDMVARNQKQYLPPLKLRLFSMRCGFFVCFLCQARFEEKQDLSLHLKVHFEEEKRKDEENMTMQRGKRRRSCEETPLKSASKVIKKRKRKKWKKSKESITCLSTAEDWDSLNSLPKEPGNSPRSPNVQEPEVFEEGIETTDEELEESRPCPVEGKECEDSGVGVGEVQETNSDTIQEEHTVDKLDEVTVIEVVNKKSPTSFSSCVFCDKIFATKGALITHQRKHLQGCLGVDFENTDLNHLPSAAEEQLKLEATSSYYSFLCSTCAMMFTSRKTLLEHEQYHLVNLEAIG